MNIQEYVEKAVEIMEDDDYSSEPKLRELTGEVVRAAAMTLYADAVKNNPYASPNAMEIRAVARRGWETFNDYAEIAYTKYDTLASDLITAEVANHLREKVHQNLGENWIANRRDEGWDIAVPSGYGSDSLVESIVAFRPL